MKKPKRWVLGEGNIGFGFNESVCELYDDGFRKHIKNVHIDGKRVRLIAEEVLK